MAEKPSAPQKRSLQLDGRDVDQRKKYVGLDPDDLTRLASIKDLVVPKVDEFTAVFFDFLRTVDEAAALFRNPQTLEEAKRLKREHLIGMVGGEYGIAYVDQRIRLGMLYSKTGLDVRVFLGAFYRLMRAIGDAIMKHFIADPMIIVDVLIDERERTINLQQEAIRELSTPALQVRDRLLILPIIGLVDSQRAKQLTDNLLHAIRANRAKVVVMDITGVAAVDSKVANHLIQTVAAARLMGATAIITGLSADVAQSLVALGVNLSSITTVGDLQGGLEEAERLLGYKVVLAGQPASRPDAVRAEP